MAEGLRERKKRAAHLAMETAAVDIAYDEGVAAVTVERVCQRAKVSRSTFFNYFSKLEEAIFGKALEYDPAITEPILTRHHDDLVVASSLIVMTTVRGRPDDMLTRRRYALFTRESGTTTTVSLSAHESRERLVTVIAAWLDEHPQDRRLPGEDAIDEARVTVGLSIVLGDEVLRQVRGLGEDVPVDMEVFHAARRRMGAIAPPPAR